MRQQVQPVSKILTIFIIIRIQKHNAMQAFCCLFFLLTPYNYVEHLCAK